MQLNDLIDRLTRFRDHHGGEVQVDVLIYDRQKSGITKRKIGNPELVLARPGFDVEMSMRCRIVAQQTGTEDDN
jgi:hypothetical protein